MSERTLSAEEVDLMVGRTWFSREGGASDPVIVHDAAVTLPELDAAKRAAEQGGPDRRLYVDGLRVEGTVSLGRGVNAVIVVLGELRAGRIELGDGVLELAYGRVVAEDVVADLGVRDREPHRCGRTRDGVAAEIDNGGRAATAGRRGVVGHGFSSRKLRSIACPCSLRMDSGWNCTPSMSYSLCRTPMISPSSVQAVTSRQEGSEDRSIAKEW